MLTTFTHTCMKYGVVQVVLPLYLSELHCGVLLCLCTCTYMYIFHAGVFEYRPVEVDEDAEMDDDPVLDTGKGNIHVYT